MSESTDRGGVRSKRGADLYAVLASSEVEVRASQALRYRVFAEEMGADLHTDEPGLDRDHFDDYCEHMLVKDRASGEIVACSRILTTESAYTTGGFYSQTEFDIKPLLKPGRRYMEIGRTCVHQDYRGGAVVAVLWGGFAQYMLEHDIAALMGCVSIPMGANGMNAIAVQHWLRERGHVSHEYAVRPRQPLPQTGLATTARPEVPPLLKGYLRAGVDVCGDAHWDRDFDVADFFVMLDRERINPRHWRHFARQGEEQRAVA